eukprot:360537-Rhodomonas_salina.5
MMNTKTRRSFRNLLANVDCKSVCPQLVLLISGGVLATPPAAALFAPLHAPIWFLRVAVGNGPCMLSATVMGTCGQHISRQALHHGISTFKSPRLTSPIKDYLRALSSQMGSSSCRSSDPAFSSVRPTDTARSFRMARCTYGCRRTSGVTHHARGRLTRKSFCTGRVPRSSSDACTRLHIRLSICTSLCAMNAFSALRACVHLYRASPASDSAPAVAIVSDIFLVQYAGLHASEDPTLVLASMHPCTQMALARLHAIA